MTDVKLNTDLSTIANGFDAAERSISMGFSETDFRSCSSTTSACSISYKHNNVHTVGIKSYPIIKVTAVTAELLYIHNYNHRTTNISEWRAVPEIDG